MTIQESLKQFIEANFMQKHGLESLGTDDSLLEAGILDSADIYELVTFVESQFEIQVPDEEVLPENFESINHLARFVEKQQTAVTGDSQN